MMWACNAALRVLVPTVARRSVTVATTQRDLVVTLFRRPLALCSHASVAELADAQGLGPCVRKDVWVQVPPGAQKCCGIHNGGFRQLAQLLLLLRRSLVGLTKLHRQDRIGGAGAARHVNPTKCILNDLDSR